MPINDGLGGNLSDTLGYGNFGSFGGNPATGGYLNSGGGLGGFFNGGFGGPGSGGFFQSLLGGGYSQPPSQQPPGFQSVVPPPEYMPPDYAVPPSAAVPSPVDPAMTAPALGSYFSDIPGAVQAAVDRPIDLTGGVPPTETDLPPVADVPPQSFTELPGAVPQAEQPSLLGQAPMQQTVNTAMKTDNLNLGSAVPPKTDFGLPPQNQVAAGKMDFLGGSLLGRPMATPGPATQTEAALPPPSLGPSDMDYLRTTPGPAGMSFTPPPSAPQAPRMSHMDELAALDAYKSPYGPEMIAPAGLMGLGNFAYGAGDMYNAAGYSSPFSNMPISRTPMEQQRDNPFESTPAPSWSRLWN